MIISLDTEATGLDLAHGAMPFLVTWCEPRKDPCYIEWDVDPHTRRPKIPEEDLIYIVELLDAAELIYLHNAKFDARALATIGIQLPWNKVRDTLTATHLLATNHPHNLTWACIEYLGKDIEPLELKVKEVTRACRTIAKRDFPSWRLAEEGLPDMPSVSASSKRDEDKPWKNDMWLPRALAKELGKVNSFRLGSTPEVPNKDWLDACAKYACGDSESAIYLGLETDRLIRERGLWKIYEHRLEVERVACEMVSYGLTAIGHYTEATIADYEEHVAELEEVLRAIAGEYGHKLELAEGASLNDNMRDFFYGSIMQSCHHCSYTKRIKHWNEERPEDLSCPKCRRGTKKTSGASRQLTTIQRDNLKLPVIESQKTGNATLDKDAMQEYLLTTEGSVQEFIRALLDKRKHGTDLTYMKSYQRFWVPVPDAPGYYRVHPSLNPCGTDHLRWASNSPNLQNVSVQEERCDECDGHGCPVCGGTGKSRLSVRACFGPAPGREWWDFDFRNLEKRIPVYECWEESLIEVFEKPDEPPYWGSDHNVLCSLLWPEEYFTINTDPKIGPTGIGLHLIKDGFKRKHSMKYKKGKNTNFAKQYGAGKRKVDSTAGVVGAFEKIERGLPKIAQLQAHYLRLAEKTGFVETLPDRTIDPNRGYPILAAMTEGGRVLSTTPFNYHVSGTACWVKNTALVRCAAQCAKWRANGFDAHIPLEVHDSILFDFPRGTTPQENLPRAMVLKGLMEQSGEDLIPCIPTPVSMSYHIETWAKETPI